jgi:hypothetical protein
MVGLYQHVELRGRVGLALHTVFAAGMHHQESIVGAWTALHLFPRARRVLSMHSF